MLKENERSTLLDRERRLARADPALARSFQNELRRPKSRPSPPSPSSHAAQPIPRPLEPMPDTADVAAAVRYVPLETRPPAPEEVVYRATVEAEKGVPVLAQEKILDNGAAAATDANVFLRAAMRQRNRPLAAHQDQRLASATSRLLETLGRALDRDPTRIPSSVRRAALRLARAISDSRPGPAGRDHRDQDTNPRRSERTVGDGSRPPFTSSIRLGRMG